MPDILHSPSDLMLVVLLASTLALGVCLCAVWIQLRRLAQREERQQRETERYVHQQIAALHEKLTGEMAREKREAEKIQHTVETSVRRRLDELQALIESLRMLEAKLQTRFAAPRPGVEETPDTTGNAERPGLSVIARSAKSGS